MAHTIRSHWGIESQAHWILDVALREDEQKADAGNIAENMSQIRRIALNLLKQEKSAKCGVEIKRQMAGWDNDYLLKVIGVKCLAIGLTSSKRWTKAFTASADASWTGIK